MSTLRCLDYRTCAKHGQSLFRSNFCIHCEKEGAEKPKPPPLTEHLSSWMRRVIENSGIKQNPERTLAMKRMERWKQRNEKKARKAAEPKVPTPREQQCAEMFARGMRVTEIAAALNCQPCSVSTWLERARIKHGLDSRQALVRIARAGR